MSFGGLPVWFPATAGDKIRWGLERTEALLAGVDDPHRRFHSVHIGGTNGKGSVAALCEAALRASGRRVGLYTSPHLVDFRERIRIGGVPLQPELLARAAERLRPLIENTGVSFFEATTVLALLCFAEAGVEIAVVEVGLGGRLDSTNVLQPVAVAITNVALDHTEYLGSSIAQIARQKAGIFKAGTPAVSGADGEALQVLREQARLVGAPFAALPDLVQATDVDSGPDGTRVRLDSVRWGRRSLSLPLRGGHQASNALIAAELLGTLPAELQPIWEHIQGGFAGVRWPGRLQVEHLRGTTWVFDVAHNPAGAAALANSLGSLGLPRPLVLVAAVLADKAWPEMLDVLAARADAVVLTLAPSAPLERSWDPAVAAAHLGGRARVVPDFAAALERAATLAPHGTVLVTGSFHTVGDAMQHLGISPF